MDNCLDNENSNTDININQELIKVAHPTSAARHLTVEKHSQMVIFFILHTEFVFN